MRTARFTNKVADTHSEYGILITFPRQKCYANAAPCFVICTVPGLLFFLR